MSTTEERDAPPTKNAQPLPLIAEGQNGYCYFCGLKCYVLRRCPACFRVGYCSETCQRSDWIGGRVHKNNCVPFNSTTMEMPKKRLVVDISKKLPSATTQTTTATSLRKKSAKRKGQRKMIMKKKK